jgi:hypothetical protein
VAALIATAFDGASDCKRAATFGVSPTASCSCRPPISPTTTSPVWMPMRAATVTPRCRAS